MLFPLLGAFPITNETIYWSMIQNPSKKKRHFVLVKSIIVAIVSGIWGRVTNWQVQDSPFQKGP